VVNLCFTGGTAVLSFDPFLSGRTMLSARTMKYFSLPVFPLWLFLMSFCVQAQTTDTTIVPAAKTWELGIGVGAITGPDYRGSKEYHHYVAPIPYVIYRGKYIQTDR